MPTPNMLTLLLRTGCAHGRLNTLYIHTVHTYIWYIACKSKSSIASIPPTSRFEPHEIKKNERNNLLISNSRFTVWSFYHSINKFYLCIFFCLDHLDIACLQLFHLYRSKPVKATSLFLFFCSSLRRNSNVEFI
jgi:hypothetical protein